MSKKAKDSSKIPVKTAHEILKMAEGGKKLGGIKAKLMGRIKEGESAYEVDKLADKLIDKTGGVPSFKMVPGYSWATCININEGIVHGVPKKKIVFKKGDVVSVDLGLFYKGFHTDTSFTVGIKVGAEIKHFLDTGKLALKKAIGRAYPGNRILDISKAIQATIEAEGLHPIKALVGHGIGRDLHEPPQIPCFVNGERGQSPNIPEGAVLAIEVMYTKGKSDVVLAEDGWTIATQDGKIAGLFEETVAVISNGPLVLSESN